MWSASCFNSSGRSAFNVFRERQDTDTSSPHEAELQGVCETGVLSITLRLSELFTPGVTCVCGDVITAGQLGLLTP